MGPQNAGLIATATAKLVTKTIRNLDWAKVEGTFGAMKPDEPRSKSQRSQFVRVQAEDAEIGAGTIQVRLLFDPQDVDLKPDAAHALNLTGVKINDIDVSNVRVRVGGPGASMGAAGQLSFTLSGSVAPTDAGPHGRRHTPPLGHAHHQSNVGQR